MKVFSDSIIQDAKQDLLNDLDEFDYIINTNLIILHNKQNYIKKNSKLYLNEIYQITNHNLDSLITKYHNYLYEIKKIRKFDYNSLFDCKSNFYQILRIVQSEFASYVTSLDFQSPSFGNAIFPQAGFQTGKISGTINDYKRDTHIDEKNYEELFVKKYIDSPFKTLIRAYMTSSGMSAFTTIYNYLSVEGKIKDKVIVGKSSYFQYKGTLVNGLKDRLVLVDETKTKELIRQIKFHKPSVIFIDSLSNTESIPVPDLRKLIVQLENNCAKDTYLIIDNTCLPIFFQPFNITLKFRSKLHIIAFESLMKYHHFGLDRATGGIIIAKGNDASKIFEYRKNLGTNISDYSVYCFPEPSKQVLLKRMLRLQRNALILSSYLKDLISIQNTPVEEIIYPTQSLPFKGSFFNLKFKKPYRSVSFYKKFINRVIYYARKKDVEIIAGTSFGLNNTRIYLTSLWTDYGEPFIRIAAGTEDIFTIQKIKNVFKESILCSNSKIPEKLLISLNKAKKKMKLDKIL
jgi:cystathionine beta-lyase/cystathionine gamma-synthase